MPERPAIDVLFEDRDCLVANKPAGLLTTQTSDHPSLEGWLRKRSMTDDAAAQRKLAATDRCAGQTLWMPHRLDRAVSGAVIVAKQRKAARLLSEQFAAGTVTKVYWGIVTGKLPDGVHHWVDSIAKDPNAARAACVTPDQRDAKPAALGWRTLRRWSGATWVELTLETGRFHQIRVQFATRGHPIWGDRLYGSEVAFGPQVTDPRDAAIALHARRLTFRHPRTAKSVTVEAPPPAYWPDETRGAIAEPVGP